MTANKDFKKLVRARMSKTGESYAAARAQLMATPPPPTLDEYPELAGMADAAVAASTGKTWVQWVDALDALEVSGLDHAAIAARVRDEWPELGVWWVQTVTVGYERIRGLRVLGQTCSGDFAASRSRTFPVPVATLFAAFGEDAREGWMGVPTVVRTSSEGRSMRLTWPDGTIVACWFTDKGSKSSVSVQHGKLPSAEHREHAKEAWGARLDALGRHLTG